MIRRRAAGGLFSGVTLAGNVFTTTILSGYPFGFVTFDESLWILKDGTWDDSGIWIDTETWDDGV